MAKWFLQDEPWILKFYFFLIFFFFRTWHFVVSYSTSVSASRGWASKSFFCVPWPGIMGSTRSLRLLVWVDTGGRRKVESI